MAAWKKVGVPVAVLVGLATFSAHLVYAYEIFEERSRLALQDEALWEPGSLKGEVAPHVGISATTTTGSPYPSVQCCSSA